MQGLHRSDVRHRDGITLTSPVRTILDLASVSPRLEVEHVIQEAFVMRLLREAELHAVLERAPRHPGSAVLRAPGSREDRRPPPES